MVPLRATERLFKNLFTTNISFIKRHFTALELKIKFLNGLMSLQVFQISEFKKKNNPSLEQSFLTADSAYCIADRHHLQLYPGS